jgi:Metallo-beta-lactamase superfamily
VSSAGGSGPRLSGPQPDELEISLFGPGYGESIAVHKGDDRWMIVDSCIDKQAGRPATLKYLEDIGVDCEAQVDTVLATHWHDDHVRGLAETLRVCATARFACSTAFNTKELLVLIESPAPTGTRVPRGVREFAEVLAILTERKRANVWQLGTPEFVIEKVRVDNSSKCDIWALSPSSAILMEVMKAFASLLPKPLQPKRCIPSPRANKGSVALWLSGPCGAALLGADLERENMNDRGWGAVLGCDLFDCRASLVKVPHHGSHTGHDQRMWDQLLVPQPDAMLTPWERAGKQVPDGADRRRICALAPATVIVGDTEAKLVKYQPAVERTLREAAVSRQSATGRTGHTRARCGPADSGRWRIELVREAERMCKAAGLTEVAEVDAAEAGAVEAARTP